MEQMKQILKATAAVIGIIAAVCLFWYIITEFLWVCYYAGFTM